MNKIKVLALTLFIISVTPGIAIAGGNTFQAADMQVFGSGDYAAGAATLNRHASGIYLRVSGNVFTANAVYSAWYIIFNNPDACAGGPGACSGADFGNPAVDVAVLNAGGFVAGGGGTGYFTGSLDNGPAPSGMCCFGKLNNGNRAEVHVLLLDHGVRNPGEIAIHMSTPGDGVDQYFFIFAPTD